jgi:hypothetical protein
MRIVSSFTIASALAFCLAASALADLSDPNADSSIPLRNTELKGPEAPLVDTQSFSNNAKANDNYAQPKSESLPAATERGDAGNPVGNSGKLKSMKQHSDSPAADVLGVPDQAVKKSVGLSDRATKSSLGLTDQAAKSSLGLSDRAAKSSVGLADRAAKTSIGVPGKILKSLF